MAYFPVTFKVFNFVLFCLLFFISSISVSAYNFQVGGKRGWIKPTGNDTQTYNGWAAKNRFRIGDTVYFKYQKDSVLVVDSADYINCSTSNPISRFDNGNTVFQFDRSGFFYFISGQPGHCKSGQKLIIRVMHPSEVETPESAPSPKAEGGSDRGGDGTDSDEVEAPGLGINSTTKLSAASYFMTALGGLFLVIFNLF